MLTARSPISSNQIHHPKSARRPLQLISSSANCSTTPINTTNVKPNPKLGWIEISLADDSNKENTPLNGAATALPKIESFDASLAEELSAIREKMERLRLDKEKTEKILRERHLKLEMQMIELYKRGEMQKMLEIEMDRLYRLKELRSSCMISSIRSLREKEQAKIKEDKSLEMQGGEMHGSQTDTVK